MVIMKIKTLFDWRVSWPFEEEGEGGRKRQKTYKFWVKRMPKR